MAKSKPDHLTEFTPVPMPAEGFLRQKQILGDPKANPPIPAIIPISHGSWWQGIKDGIYPAPVKIGRRSCAWKVSDIRDLIERINQSTGEAA